MMKTLYNYLLKKEWLLRILMCFLSAAKKEQIYIARFKREFAFWGHDVSDMTDNEIKEAISKMAEMIAYYGMEKKEIGMAFQTIATCQQHYFKA